MDAREDLQVYLENKISKLWEEFMSIRDLSGSLIKDSKVSDAYRMSTSMQIKITESITCMDIYRELCGDEYVEKLQHMNDTRTNIERMMFNALRDKYEKNRG
jgi:hypothetical protein